MSTTTALISIEEYLDTSYHPDCDFVDGYLEERNLGEYEHGRMQSLLTMWFGSREVEWNFVVVTELRTRVASDRVRIPDVCLIRADVWHEPVTVTPPFLCIEVLSSKDRLSRTLKVMDDYLKMGVENLWIIDPIERTAYTYTQSGLRIVDGGRITVEGSPVYVDLDGLFARLPKSHV